MLGVTVCTSDMVCERHILLTDIFCSYVE